MTSTMCSLMLLVSGQTDPGLGVVLGENPTSLGLSQGLPTLTFH